MYEDKSSLCRYGTPLPPLEEDTVPSKKPVYAEDQIVTDENGRRRFHGAFTGGFSAGYWNTVGSQEGWTPQTFKSSRGEKAEQRQQLRPEDFMDDEDKGEFGIAPQRVQTRDEFAPDDAAAAGSARKRKFAQPGLGGGGTIPGVPVLHELLLTPTADKAAVRILTSMGWRPGQGIGPRQTRREKKEARTRNKREMYLMQHYGCAPQDGLKASTINDSEHDVSSSSADDDDDDEITFAPDDYEPFFVAAKDNRFGLGYTGLSREPVLSKGSAATAAAAQHINLFGPLEVLAKDNNNKLSISGQAFGVGALEEEDDDIYERDDMTKYDFSLDDRKAPRKKVAPHVQDRNILEGFVAEPEGLRYKPEVFRVTLPPGWKPRNWAVRKSRFEPLDAEKEHELNLNADFRRCGLGRHELNPQQRGDILGEQAAAAAAAEVDEEMPMTSKQAAAMASTASTSVKPQCERPRSAQDRTKALLELISARSDNFTRGGIITTEGEEKAEATAVESTESMVAAVQQENQQLLAKAGIKTKSLASIPASSGGFKPFLNNEPKQLRYEQFLDANLQDEQEISAFLATIQPVHLSEWDREMEKKEFIQARKIYKPLGGMMSDRFVSEETAETKKKDVPAEPEIAKDTTEKKIIMERTKTTWKPAALLCKRYNIAEPYGGNMQEDKPQSSRKPKLSVFDYLESSINTKANFKTPVIIPKHIEKPKAIIKDTERPQKLQFLETTIVAPGPETQIKAPTAPLPPTAIARNNKTIEKSLEYVPKTELEKLNIASRNKPAAEKLELFKAIFEDSDEDDGATAKDAADTQQLTKTQPPVNADVPPPTLAMPISAAAANLLRNSSPPRGIFAALFTTAADDGKKELQPSEKSVEPSNKLEKPKMKSTEIPTKIAFKSRAERLKESREEGETIEPDTNTYGPKIPAHIKKSTPAEIPIPASDVDSRLIRLLEMQKPASKHSIAEQWVEKSELGNETSTDSSSDSGSSSSDDSKAKRKKSKKSKSKKHKAERVRKHKKKDKKKSKKREKSSHKSKKSKKSS